MTNQEALQMLDQAVSQLSVPREAHVKLQEAINTLSEAVKPVEKKETK